MEELKAVTTIGMIISGLIAFMAVAGGLQEVGLHWSLSGIAAFALIAVSPLLGLIVGVWGAHEAWGLSWFVSALIFLWPVVVGLAAGFGVVGTSQIVNFVKRTSGPDTSGTGHDQF